MTKGRLEAFSDGVIAIIITIMVLELKVPHGSTLDALMPLWPVFLSYVLSFVYVGIYWNNHHNMLHSAGKVSGKILWSNLHLLFWLSLFPFATSWMGEEKFTSAPVAIYGIVLLAAAVAYYILAQTLAKAEGPDSAIAKGLGTDFKGRISIVVYAVGIVTAFFAPLLSCLFYSAVAIMWVIPDRRFLAQK